MIGRKQPPASAVEAIARAYFALDARPFDLGDGGYDVRRRPLQDKIGRIHLVTTHVHMDPRINRILGQVREAEVIQTLDRVRAVRFPRRVLLLNALDLRRLNDAPATEGLGVPADRCLSWPEIRKTEETGPRPCSRPLGASCPSRLRPWRALRRKSSPALRLRKKMAAAHRSV